MTSTSTRELIEVALPLEAINRESAREKSIRHGHPSTLHLWWARRPLAACRAIVFVSLVDDPSSRPEQFPTAESQDAERQRLFRIIEDLVRWENTTNETVLDAARAEITRSCDGQPPPVYDPFCGGGSIPLEAQRLGLEAHGSDLNPVAVLITKALIEIPPRFAGRPPIHPDGGRLATGARRGAQGLADDVRYYGKWMRDEAECRIGHLYPTIDGRTVIAWIWARTVRSPNPAWDGPMPLVRSFALSAKKGRETWVQPVVDREHKQMRFEIRTGPGCPEGTVGRNGAVGLATRTPEMATRLRSMSSNALASSIALVCRPRPDTASLASRKELLAALKAELPQALRNLQQGSIAPVDLAQSAIGPGMGVFSRYAKVVEADGSAMSVRTALGLINGVLDETLGEQESDFDGDTRWALAWFDEVGTGAGAYGLAETLSKAKNTSIAGLVEAGFLESRAGKVRLLDRSQLPGTWDPATDARLTVWEVAQNLILALETGGEPKAAELLRRVGGLGETAKELAYRLYVICERKKWAKEALAYNALVVAWPEISRLAAGAPTSRSVQEGML